MNLRRHLSPGPDLMDFQEAIEELQRAVAAFPVPDKLYHATRAANLPSIQEDGLRKSFCGNVHGACNVGPPEPCVYLSRLRSSNNLCTALFVDQESGEAHDVVVLEIDAARIDLSQAYCDDFLYDAWAEQTLLADPEDLSQELGISLDAASALFEAWDETPDAGLAAAMRPLARWYLNRHGEIAYPSDVPSDAILAIHPYDPDPTVGASWNEGPRLV